MSETVDLDGHCWAIVSKTPQHLHLRVNDGAMVMSTSLTLSYEAAARLWSALAAVLMADQPPVS